ncbi:MAG TPA: nucleotidyltransferase domain-containing protein [Armatimonadota bacterium]|nr:nucleotidyltransferase domain-containing protein [Armatimonadota bacterium]
MALGPSEVDAIVARYLERVRQRVPVAAAYLYGSYATGEADDDSDIDMAIISPAFGSDVAGEMSLLMRACWPDATHVEALPFSDAELENPSRGSFLREVLKTGRRVA